jgi:hypothetical protein
MFQAAKKFFGKEAQAEPSPEAVEWLKQCQLTPDIWKLEQFMYKLLFVSDDLMMGRKNHSLIEEYVYAGAPLHPTCYTSQKFTFWRKDLGVNSFPIPMEYSYKPSNWVRVQPIPARIKGELYAIRPNALISLDNHRQNGLQFRRVTADILLPYREVKYSKDKPNPTISDDRIYTLPAQMYVGIPEYWDDMIGDMFTVREVDQYEFDTPKKWIDRYYRFE